MTGVAHARILSTLLVDSMGRISTEPGIRSYSAGFAGLLQLMPPRTNVAILRQGAPTALSFVRIGAALRSSLMKSRV